MQIKIDFNREKIYLYKQTSRNNQQQHTQKNIENFKIKYSSSVLSKLVVHAVFDFDIANELQSIWI